MNIIQMVLVFYFGMMSMWNFMRTAYVYSGIPSFYAADAVAMCINFFLAWAAVKLAAKL